MSGLPSWAKAGARVACTTDKFKSNFDPAIKRPVAGRVYTIREAVMRRGLPQIRLVEIRNRVGNYSTGRGEASFHTCRFQPLVTRTLDDDMATHFDHHLHLHDFHPEPV